jgi:diguanylate cyclase (GGDEF)-like protein
LSFGRRLILFFVLIVVLPMLAVAALLLQVTSESRTGKADARLAAGFDTALSVARASTSAAERRAQELARDPRVANVMRGHLPDKLRGLAVRLATEPGVVGVILESPDGSQWARAGDPEAMEYGRVTLNEPGTEVPIGTLAISTTTADIFAERVAQLTSRGAVVLRGGDQLAGTVEIPAGDQPEPGKTKDLSAGGEEYRARTAALTDGDALVLLGPAGSGGPTLNAGIVLLLALLFGAAVAFSFFLARTLHNLHELTSEQAVTDELTGLSNQRQFRELLGNEVARATRFGHPLSLLMLDIDDFKAVNDRHGHLQGDDVLAAVAAAIAAEVREVDEPARYGGEEFAVVLPETDPAGAAELAERIRSSIAADGVPARAGGGTVSVTASIGVAGLGGKAEDAEGLVAEADEALYEAKKGGKDRVHSAGARGRAPRRRKKAARAPRKKPARGGESK